MLRADRGLGDAHGVAGMVKILVAEDERGLAGLIGRGLAAMPDCAIQLSPQRQWLGCMLRDRFDLLLGLDDPGFLDLLRRLRHIGSRVPVIVVAASATAEARVHALRAGADDAVDHPCETEELLLRVARLTRCVGPPSRRIAAAGLVIDRLERRVWREGQEIALLPREFALLLCLVRNPGTIFDRRALLAAVWKLAFDPGTNVVEVHMSRLRAKIDRGFGRPLIETVKGAGYRLATPREIAPVCQKIPSEQVTGAFARVG